ncbi:MAG: CHAT domain-containing protein [Oscillatoriales cyanobacterium C42_A2020_001]|nr:CHAT domain-containing protein [Leptolyngbyaceae cyanobacterium C42_A2020_001]
MLLNNLAEVYLFRRDFEAAFDKLQQSFEIVTRSGDQRLQGIILDSFGQLYSGRKKPVEALAYYQKALTISREIQNRASERITLSNLGDLFAEQRQPELAILFYKQSVNVTEAIRKDLRPLPRSYQESYTQTVAETYRKLADLLLQQDRVLEAQQVLDLLKVQELDDYLRNVRGVGQQVEFLRPETEILKRYGKLQETAIRVGRELAELRKKGALTDAEKQHIAKLDRLETSLNEQFGQFIRSDEVKKLIAQLSPEVQAQIVKLSDLEALRDDLRRMNAVMIYPLVLSDRLELIITTPDTIPLRRTVPIKRETLNAAILEFRRALQSPGTDAKPIAQKLYSWLIQPLEADLKQATPQTLIYAPDGQLRYIPLAALHDGQQWLVQRYQINNITAKSLTKFNNPSQVQMRVLAGAFTDAATTYPVKVGERNFSFKGLPFAGQEVTNLAALFPGTNKVLDRAFSLASIKPLMNGFSVVHLATHAAFVPGDPSNSFILFGDGSFATLRDIENWSLNNVDLVVLSACETGVGVKAVGDRALGNGEEVLGLGYQFQNRGARATLASLWQVDDGGTQELMTAFYTALKQLNMTKAGALQQAQIAMINSQPDNRATDTQRSSVVYTPGRNQAAISSDRSHPYYWAPFILIGNGL